MVATFNDRFEVTWQDPADANSVWAIDRIERDATTARACDGDSGDPCPHLHSVFYVVTSTSGALS